MPARPTFQVRILVPVHPDGLRRLRVVKERAGLDAVPTWKWLLGIFFLVSSAFCSGTETALTALGDARARQLRDSGGRRGRLLGLWIDHPERVLSTR